MSTTRLLWSLPLKAGGEVRMYVSRNDPDHFRMDFVRAGKIVRKRYWRRW